MKAILSFLIVATAPSATSSVDWKTLLSGDFLSQSEDVLRFQDNDDFCEGTTLQENCNSIAGAFGSLAEVFPLITFDEVCILNADGILTFGFDSGFNATCPVCDVQTNICFGSFSQDFFYPEFNEDFPCFGFPVLQRSAYSLNLYGGVTFERQTQVEIPIDPFAPYPCTQQLNGVECNSCSLFDPCQNDCSNVIPEAKVVCDADSGVTQCPEVFLDFCGVGFGDTFYYQCDPTVVFAPRGTGDPHFTTFDGYKYDCQAHGEFSLMKSETTDFHVQTRLVQVGASSASVTTGFAVAVPDAPTIQVSLNPDASATTCLEQTELFVDGTKVALASGAGSDVVSVSTVGTDEVVVNYEAGFELHVLLRDVPSFGCYFSFWSHLSPTFLINRELVGLMGTPNGIVGDDWQDSTTGLPITMPDDDQAFFGPAYDYCVQNWCITDESASLFTYNAGETFLGISGCSVAYDGALEAAVNSVADANLIAICNGSIECLMDGVTGGTEAATKFNADEEATATAAEERFEEDRISTIPGGEETITPQSPLDQFLDFLLAPFRFVWGIIQSIIDSLINPIFDLLP